MALGLAAAHEVGLVHRDMKPANILLENGIQRVRITDFGLARAVDDVSITQSGVVSGTPLYMSPEQASGETIDHRSDLFSLGSVLYTMCTGRPAFRAQTTVAVIRRVCDDVPRPIREINADVPDWLADIIVRLISKQPDDRIQTAAEVAECLGGHLAHLQDSENVQSPATITPGASDDEKRATRPRRLLLPVALLLGIFTLSVTEAAGITNVSEFLGIVLKLKTSEGTLVVEIEDPNVKVSVDGDEVVIDGIGVHELRLKPGKHQFTTQRNGAPASQEWVTIERGGKKVLRILRLPPEKGPDQPVDGGDTPTTAAPGDGDIQHGPSVDGVTFQSNVRLQRFGSQSVVVAPGVGKLIFPSVPEQLFGQRCAMAEVERESLKFQVQNRSFGGEEFQFVARHGGSARQRLWLLVPEANWGPRWFEDDFAYDTRESLAKRNWQAWRTLTSYHATTDPKNEANYVKWAVFYRDTGPNENFSIRTHANRTPMLVWGSLLIDDILLDVQWDQRVSVFNPGASVSLGNGDHVFDEVPEFLAGRLYTKRNGYQGFVRFRAERDQRIVVGMYDWREMNSGNTSGGWKEELTPPDTLKKTGWEEVATLQPRHTRPDGSATWHFYARDCKRGETFMLRSHKYQAPIVFSERPAGLNAPAPEGIEFRLPTATDIERQISESVVEFNRRFKERRYAEALVVAKQALDLDPGNTTCITMLLKAQQALLLPGINLPREEPVSPAATAKSGTAIKLDATRVTTRIAPSVGEPAVYGVGSPVTPIRDFPVFFDARAKGRHPDGARKLVGQIAGPVQPGDTIVVDRLERTGHLIRLQLRHAASPQRKSKSSDAHSLEDINPLEEARRLTVRYEKAQGEQPNQKDVKQWLLIIARHLAARANMESDVNESRKLREQARERVMNARKLFAAEVADSEPAYEAFPIFIDREKDPNLHSQKSRAVVRYISAQLQLATCTMVEALSHELDSDERADRLNVAAGEFETLHRKYRTQLGGLFAHVQQGRCLQFLGKPEAALGIYSELLAFPGKSDSMLRVRNRALHFSLISLNDERNDWHGVMRQANEWLANAPLEHRRSVAGAGILWEEARAMWGTGEDTPIRPIPELMGDDNGELILRATLKLLRQVQDSEGQHSGRAAQRIQDVLALLDNNGEGAPGDASSVSPARAAEASARNSLGDGDPLESARDLTRRYEKFLAENPDNKAVSQTLMSLARNLMTQAALENEPDVIPGLLSQARQRCASARTLFDAEFAGAKAKFESFSVFIDREKDPKLWAQRQAAGVEFIEAQLQLATCTFVESLTHSADSDQRTRKLTNAAAAFEELHKKYRTQVGGLYGRLWQGRCLQLLGDHRAALGIFNELLQHPGESGSIRSLHNYAVHFRLISLNDDSRRDWQLVLDESRRWMEGTTEAERNSSICFGVTWEMSRAMLGDSGDRTLAGKILASLGVERGVDVRPQLKALALDMQKELRKKYPGIEVVAGDGNAGARNPVRAVARDDPPSQSLYFQVRLPALPPGDYHVDASLRSLRPTKDPLKPAARPTVTVSGKFAVPGSDATAAQLKLLTTRAIMMKPVPDEQGLSIGTQRSTGLDLAPLLASSGQKAASASFPKDHVKFEAYCGQLAEDGKHWALCTALDHSNVDAKIYAARQLAAVADANTVAVLLAAAKRNNYGVSGSESATLHSVYRSTLKKALEAATALKLTPNGLKYQTIRNGESVTVTSDANPELFVEYVTFDRVEDWLRNVYLADRSEGSQPIAAPNDAETGLIGRVEVDGKDGGVLFHYRHAKLFVHEDVPETIHDSKGFTVTLDGYVVVPRDMLVQVWQAGGGVSHDNNWLTLDGTQLCVTGDDHDKHYKAELPLLKGLHHVRWELTGGTFRANILFFMDPESGELLRLINKGESSIRRSPDETRIEIKGEKLDWPIKTEWLPASIQKLNGLTAR